MTVLDEIYAYGHQNIQCVHNSTIELTKDDYLTLKGTCIIGIKASKACYDLNPELKTSIRSGEKIKIILEVDGYFDSFYGYGSEKLTLLSKKDLVFRKSTFICDRTVLIRCSKSSNELNRVIIDKLNNRNEKVNITFENSKID